jgi:hypothetical protein
MIQVQVVDLLNAEKILTKIKKDAEKNGLNFNLSYKLKRLLDKVNPEYADIYEQRDKLFKKFGEEQEIDGQKQLRVPPEKVETFQKYWEDLLNTEVELFNVFKFSIEELKLSEKYTLEEVAFLEPFLEKMEWEAEPERKKININLEEDTVENVPVEEVTEAVVETQEN